MDFSSVNWIAVFVAAGSAFALGAVWYSPLLFGKRWQALGGLSDDDIKNANMGAMYGGALVLQIIAVVVLALFLPPEATLASGALTGLGISAAWVATAMGVTYLFEQKSFAFYAINAGYHVAYYTIAGAILGVF